MEVVAGEHRGMDNFIVLRCGKVITEHSMKTPLLTDDIRRVFGPEAVYFFFFCLGSHMSVERPAPRAPASCPH